MNIEEMTRKQFEELPYRDKWNTPVTCHSLVLLPMRTRHESGYRNIDIIAVDDEGEATVRLSGSSDDIEIVGQAPRIDCLPKSGLFHLWLLPGFKFRCGSHLSSIRIDIVKGETK